MAQQKQYDFEGVNNVAAWSSAEIERRLRKLSRTVSVQNVENDRAYRDQDVDLVLVRRNLDGSTTEHKIEIKADQLGHRTGNLFFETISNVDTGTPGCFLYSEADLLFYHLVEAGEVYVFDFARIRKWFLANQEQFGEPRRPRTPLKNGESYETEGYRVPLRRIMKEAPPLFTFNDLPIIPANKSHRGQDVPRKM